MGFIRKAKQRSRRLLRIIIVFALFLFVSSIIYESSSFDNTESLSCSQLCPYSSIVTNDTLQFDSSHIIRHFPNFVCPQNFRNLADWVYGWPNQFDERLKITTDQGKYIAPCLPSGSIIYVRIWVIEEFFDKVYPHLQNDFVLITGEGDIKIPSPAHMKYLQSPYSKLIHWFGQNGQYHISTTQKFTHIPIGKLFRVSRISPIGDKISSSTSFFSRYKLLSNGR
jgi:hypothetical protein